MSFISRPASGSASSIISTSTQSPHIFEATNVLSPHINASSSNLLQTRAVSNGQHISSSNQIFEHNDPRLLHGDTYLHSVPVPIPAPGSRAPPGTHIMSSSMSNSNPSLYGGVIARGIEDNGMDSPTYIQLDSNPGGVLSSSGSYTSTGNTIYSTTLNSLSGGGVIAGIGNKSSVEYTELPIYGIKSNPSSHR